MINKSILYAVDKNTRPIFFATNVEQTEEGYGKLITATGRVGGKISFREKIIKQGKNIGKSNETSPYEQAISEMHSKHSSMLDKGYKPAKYLNKQYNAEKYVMPITPDFQVFKEDLKVFFIRKTSTINHFFLHNNIRTNTFPTGEPMPMLAQSYNKDQHNRIGHWMMQRKLNGVRCLAFLVDGKVKLISRKGKEYKIPHISNQLLKLFNMSPNLVLDGELYIHDKPLGKIVSWVKDPKQEKTKQLEYHVYDLAVNLKYIERLQLLVKHSTSLSFNNVKFVETKKVSSIDNLKAFESKVISEGYEGVMLRNLDAYYASGYRSENLLKVKQFFDEEFVILGLGDKYDGLDIDTFTFKLKNNKDDQTFDARPRGTREDKKWFARNIEKLKGKLATVRYQERTEYNLPHQAHIVTIRDYE